MSPVAINRQKCRCTARDGTGRPGERIAGLSARSARHCRRSPSGASPVFLFQSPIAILSTSEIKVLRRPIESAHGLPIKVATTTSELAIDRCRVLSWVTLAVANKRLG